MIEQINTDQYAADGLAAGCPAGQMEYFIRAGIVLQPRQLAASAAARLCDQPADVLKTNTNEEGVGGDDAADALRYMVATESRKLYQRKLTGWR